MSLATCKRMHFTRRERILKRRSVRRRQHRRRGAGNVGPGDNHVGGEIVTMKYGGQKRCGPVFVYLIKQRLEVMLD
jgi:hypothetical protein